MRLKVLAPTVVGETVLVPLVGSVPLQAPLAVQELALFTDQVRVALWPETMEIGWTVSDTAGVGGGGALLPPP